MRELAFNTIKTAAVSLGMKTASIMDQPAKQNITLPTPRLEIEYLDETLTRSVSRIAKFNAPDKPETHRAVRSRIYTRSLLVRAVIRTDDPDWLSSFVNSLLVTLPAKMADSENNLVEIRATKTVRGGFQTKMVEPFIKRSNALHIEFSGMITKDVSIPLITEVNVRDGVTIQ